MQPLLIDNSKPPEVEFLDKVIVNPSCDGGLTILSVWKNNFYIERVYRSAITMRRLK